MRLVVDAKQRVRVPATLAPGWAAGGQPSQGVISFLPLIWAREGVLLPEERQLEAWALCDFDRPCEEGSKWDDHEWLVSPHEVREHAQSDPTARELASMIVDARPTHHPGGWRIVLPEQLRLLGCLPSAGEVVEARPNSQYLELWTAEGWKLQVVAASRRWSETRPR